MKYNRRISRYCPATPRWDDEGPWCSYEMCIEWIDGRCNVTKVERNKQYGPYACQAIAIVLRRWMTWNQKEQASIVREYVRQKSSTLKLESCRWLWTPRGVWLTECEGEVSIIAAKQTGLYTYCPRCGKPIKTDPLKSI